MSEELEGHDLVFVAGLHRSGTSLLANVLADHADVTRLSGTGVSQDEGQHLQTVYPPASALGGPGRFASHPDAHLTERSELVSEANRRKLLEAWLPYWDSGRRVLVEKSPPNLVRTRFLQALFPWARFLVIMRHPLAVVAGEKKRVGASSSLASLLRHWLTAHECFLADAPSLSHLRVVRYADLVERPADVVEELARWLPLGSRSNRFEIRAGLDERYLDHWRRRRYRQVGLLLRSGSLERRLRVFGYSLRLGSPPSPPSPLLRAMLIGAGHESLDAGYPGGESASPISYPGGRPADGVAAGSPAARPPKP
ncbi:MAG: sulfotransferase family protein [Solirubrobacterales bacterium]